MSDTRLNQLIINKLTKAQYDALPQETKESNQLFFTTDEVPLDSSDIATTINSSSTNSKAAGALAVYNYHDSTKQNSITSSNKLSADLVVNGSTNKVVTQTEKNTWNNKSTVIASTSTVSGATTAQSLSINGSSWNLGGGGTSDFNSLTNRPSYNGTAMTNVTNIPEVKTATWDGHISSTSNPHGVTKTQVGLGNVENKSSATIRSELTSANVTTALGYTPLRSTDIVDFTNAEIDAIWEAN